MKEINILKIVKEDLLRILIENKGKTSFEKIKEEIKVSNFFLKEGIKHLKEEKLIVIRENFIKLTRDGEKRAKDILKKHLVIEKYFKETRSKEKAHELAEILEHYVSEEVLNNIKKLFTFGREESFPLTKLDVQRDKMVTDILIRDDKLLERIISMGIFPGEVIKKTNEIPNGIIVKVGNKKFALDKIIAKKIRVLK